MNKQDKERLQEHLNDFASGLAYIYQQPVPILQADEIDPDLAQRLLHQLKEEQNDDGQATT